MLILEAKKGEPITSIIIGINPGQADEDEREWYRREEANYEAMKKYWETRIKNIRYYKRLRALIRQLGYKKGIL